MTYPTDKLKTFTRNYCIAGYYCTSGVDRPNPGANNVTLTDPSCACPTQAYFTGVGGVCPLGHYCPSDSSHALPCEAGSYADREGMAVCTVCPASYYCLANSTEFLTAPCPVGK